MITEPFCFRNEKLSSKQFLWLVFLACFVSLCQAQYDDVRCKCVCPKDMLQNNIVVKYVKVEECTACQLRHCPISFSTCEDVVKLDQSSCLLCQCKYEARNTTLIKVVVIFIIVILFVLIIYMIGISIYSIWKPRGLSVTSDVIQERLLARSRALSRLDSKMSKWKASVGEQRRNVYDHHSMLS